MPVGRDVLTAERFEFIIQFISGRSGFIRLKTISVSGFFFKGKKTNEILLQFLNSNSEINQQFYSTLAPLTFLQ